MSDVIQVFRHYLATLAFRLKRVTHDAPEGFSDFNPGSGVRTPLEILRHMSVLISFTQRIIVSAEIPSAPDLSWSAELDRFRLALKGLDDTLQALETPEEEALLKALQGPLADAMTHIGQLATLRRMAGAPLEGISYAKADIEIGKF